MEAPPAEADAAERTAVRAKNADATIKQYKLDERLDQWQLGAMRDILQQHHVFITGSAGNGKSHLIQTLHANCAAALLTLNPHNTQRWRSRQNPAPASMRCVP